MKKILGTIVLAMLLLQLVGCVGISTYNIGSNRFVAEAFHDNDYRRVIRIYEDSKGDVHYYHLGLVCDSYFLVRNHAGFQLCFEQFKKEKAAGGVDMDILKPLVHKNAVLLMEQGRYDASYKILIELVNANTPFNLFASLETLYAREAEYKAKLSLITLYGLLGEREKAAPLVKEVLGMLNSVFARLISGHSRIDYNMSNARSRVAIAIGDFEKAYEYSHQGYQVGIASFFQVIDFAKYLGGGFEAGFNRFFEVELPYLYLRAHTAYKTERYAEAKEEYLKLLKHKAFGDFSSLHYNAYYHLGRIELAEGKPAQAIQYFKQSIDIIEIERSSINVEASKIGFVGGKQNVYRDLIASLIKQGKFTEAFEYAERGKSRALVDMLASKQQFSSRSTGISSAQLLAELNKAEQASLRLVAANEFASGKTRSVVDQQLSKIKASNPELASLVTVSAVSLKDIQKQLVRDETLLEYYGDANKLFAFVVTRNKINAIVLDARHIKQLVNDYRASLTDYTSKNYKQTGNALYNVVVKPVKRYIKTNLLTVVPHGVLHYAPFSALYDGERYMVDSYQLRVLPSASMLTFINKKKLTQKGTLLLLGNPDLGDASYNLPGAEQEALLVAKITTNAKVLLRKNATETALKKYGPLFKQIHFAMHGQFDAKQPLSSSLLMTADAMNDGRLTVSELYDLQLNTDLVTLSACETALGETAGGDDVVGFTRGFLYAGAKSIISSLWSVEDESTRELMVSFYTNLKRQSKGRALQKAQQKVKKKYTHPFFWAAFQLTGNN